MNRRSDHAPDHRGGNWLHDVGADSTFPEYWYEACQNRCDRHELRTQSLYRAFDRRRFNIFMFDGYSRGDAFVERLMEIHHHDHPSLHGNSKEGDVAHPDGDAEVVAQQILENQASGHSIKSGEN